MLLLQLIFLQPNLIHVFSVKIITPKTSNKNKTPSNILHSMLNDMK